MLNHGGTEHRLPGAWSAMNPENSGIIRRVVAIPPTFKGLQVQE